MEQQYNNLQVYNTTTIRYRACEAAKNCNWHLLELHIQNLEIVAGYVA